jgi:alkanesulfonate monooxygenase SsuD/methylene tetrahydromethanopterin reductase-like flavin-dependent oxidoreductase (luciferase family)
MTCLQTSCERRLGLRTAGSASALVEGGTSRRWKNHGAGFRSRWKLLCERIEAMKKLWTEDEASYHGEFVNFDPVSSWPKPLQKAASAGFDVQSRSARDAASDPVL